VVTQSSGYLLDTNVISELMKARPAPSVVSWIVATPEDLLHLSVITVGEIRKGIDLLDEDEPRRGTLQSWLDHDLRIRFAGRLLPFDEGAAERWGQIEALAKRQRLTLPTIDAQLVATALHHGLTFVTRNVSDVRATGVPLFNPWSRPHEEEPSR
jgi:toxin FitB